MCAYDDEEADSECMALGACFHVLKPLDTGTFNILKQKELQHRCRRVITEELSILNKTKSRMDSSSTKKPKRRFIVESSNVHGSETEEDEEPDVWKAYGYSKKPGRITWNTELHEMFLQAVEVLGESAKPGRIHRQMNVKDLTKQQIASHLQKHRLREQRVKQGQNQQNARIKPASQLITSSFNAATSEPINQLATTRIPITPRVSAATRGKHPRRLWTQVEKSPAKAAASKTTTHIAAIFGDDTKSVWDKYHKSLHYQKSLQKEFSASYKRKVLPVKSKAGTQVGGSANIAPNAAGEKSYGTPASAPLESSGSNSMLTRLLHQVGENSRTEAAGNNGNLENFTMYEDSMSEAYAAAMGADGLVDLGSNALLDGTENYYTAEMGLSDPFYGWNEVKTFWRAQLEGPREHQGDLLQEDNAWKDALQPASLANMDDAPIAQEPTIADAPAYDPAQQFTIGDALWTWSPQVVGDYGMLL